VLHQHNCHQGAGKPSPLWKTINPFTTACSPKEVGQRQKTDSSSYHLKLNAKTKVKTTKKISKLILS
jgi:hypothetical protein